jgi:hypothetical protein
MTLGRIEVLLQLRRADELAGLVPALVELPADILVAGDRGGVITLRRPQHPFAGLGIHEQRQDFLAVGKPVPADRAVAVGHDDELAVARNVHAPGYVRPTFAQELFAVCGDRYCRHRSNESGKSSDRDAADRFPEAVGSSTASPTTRPVRQQDLR